MQGLSLNLANIPVSLSNPSPSMAWQAEDSLLASVRFIRNVCRKETPCLEIQLLSCPRFFQSQSGFGAYLPFVQGWTSLPCLTPGEAGQSYRLSAEVPQNHLCSLFCTVSVLMLKLFSCENIAAHISHLHSFRLYQGIHFILQLKATLICSILRKNAPLTFKYTVSCCRKSDLQWNLVCFDK